ncbi:BTB/POZ domain-containing protein [Aphelenchoides avenae]|nr:BTB/POZ domain-containing protein [Aphelenchus avenae]
MGTLTLKVNDIYTYMTKIGELTESPPQQVAGIGWHVLAFPSVVDKMTYLSCYLAGENASKWTAWVDATFRIVKHGGGVFNNVIRFRKKLMGKTPLGDDWGWKMFVTSQNLLNVENGFVVNDSVEVRVDFSVTDVGGTSLNVFDIPGAFAADVRLKVGDNAFYANKGYLSVASSVFRDMFMSEAADGKKDTEEIELQDVDANEFKEFLGVVYPTRYPITDANVISLLRIADRYDVKHVIPDCERHLLGANEVPWFDKLKVAVDLHRDDLRKKLTAMMTSDDTREIELSESRDELGKDVLREVSERNELLNTGSDSVVDASDEIHADSSITDACFAASNVFEIDGALAADVKLKIGDSVFYASKGYLSVLSSVFRDMFAFTEAAEGKKDMDEIELKDLDASEFNEFLRSIYPTCCPITDSNVLSLFRIADRFDVKRVIADCEYHLFGDNSVPWFNKQKLAADLNSYHLKKHLTSKMTWDDFETVDQHENKDQLRMDVLQALIDEHIRVCRP